MWIEIEHTLSVNVTDLHRPFLFSIKSSYHNRNTVKICPNTEGVKNQFVRRIIKSSSSIYQYIPDYWFTEPGISHINVFTATVKKSCNFSVSPIPVAFAAERDWLHDYLWYVVYLGSWRRRWKATASEGRNALMWEREGKLEVKDCIEEEKIGAGLKWLMRLHWRSVRM